MAGLSWRVCPGYVNGAALNSHATITQAMEKPDSNCEKAKRTKRNRTPHPLEALGDERRRHEQIIQKGTKTRLENKRAARYKRMGGQTEPPPLRWSSLFDSDLKEADEGVIVVKSGAGDAAGTPRKKKLLLHKRRFRLGSWDKRTASESDDRHHETVDHPHEQ